MIEVVWSENNIHIVDSYLVDDIRGAVGFLRNVGSNEVLSHRSDYSLCCEWAVHNFLYRIGLFRSHTKDVDLNYPCRMEWLYIILGTLIFPFWL